MSAPATSDHACREPTQVERVYHRLAPGQIWRVSYRKRTRRHGAEEVVRYVTDQQARVFCSAHGLLAPVRHVGPVLRGEALADKLRRVTPPPADLVAQQFSSAHDPDHGLQRRDVRALAAGDREDD